MPPLTNERHVANGGSTCPACGATTLTGGSVTIEAGRALQGVACDGCDATWVDEYRLVGFSELDT